MLDALGLPCLSTNVSREGMNRFLATIIFTALLIPGPSCLGALVTHKAGVFFQIHGRCYGLYDERYADLLASDGKIVGGAYWSGIDLGPLGRFGTSSTHPWIKQAATPVLVLVCVLGSVVLARRLCGIRLTRSLHSTPR
jgi:hypothetical protein